MRVETGMRWIATVGLALVFPLASAPFLAPPAWAHGGQFVPPPPTTPGGAVPHGTPRGNTPTHVNPGTGGPVVTPGGGFMKPGTVGKRHRRDVFTPTREISWQFWWDLHQPDLLPPRPASLSRAVITPEGTAPAPDRDRWEADRDRLVEERILPFLLEVLDPNKRQDDDVRASAALALGKLARDASAIPVLLAWVQDERAPDLVRESAALALGLLRRTDPSRQLTANELDPLRAKLLMLWDRQVDGRRVVVPARTRQFAMFAIGLLGDQPWHQDPQSKNGRLLSTLVWQRYTRGRYKDSSYRIALLSALGLQPSVGIPDAVRREVEALARGEKVGGRRARAPERAHGLTTAVRLGDRTATSLLIRRLSAARDEKNPPALRLAAVLALGDRVDRIHATERLLVARILERAMQGEQELLVMGLANLALGRLVGADLADGSTRVLDGTKAASLLGERASKGPWYLKGFGTLGLALAVRQVPDDCAVGVKLRSDALVTFRRTLQTRTLESDLRGAAAAALGLLRAPGAVPDLCAVVANPTADGELRAHAALALGQIGVASDEVVAALEAAATEEGPEGLRARAALGLSLLGRSDSVKALVAQLRGGRRTSHLAGVTLALGHLGHLDAVEPLLEVAAEAERPELVRAMAIVALGVLADPEERPSLLRLSRGTAYPVRTRALEEAFTIM